MKYFQYNDLETNEPMVSMDLTAQELLSIHIALSKDVQSHTEWLANDSERKFMVDKLSLFAEKCELNGAFSTVVDSIWDEYTDWQEREFDEAAICDECIQEMIDKAKEGK